MEIISSAFLTLCFPWAAYLHLATYTHGQSQTSQTEKLGYKLSLQFSSLNYSSKVKAEIYSEPNILNLAITTGSCRAVVLTHLPARLLQRQIEKRGFSAALPERGIRLCSPGLYIPQGEHVCEQCAYRITVLMRRELPKSRAVSCGAHSTQQSLRALAHFPFPRREKITRPVKADRILLPTSWLWHS